MAYKSEKRECKKCQEEFAIEPNDFSFYEKIKLKISITKEPGAL